MKKFLLIFFVVIFGETLFAQKDTEHWFAPLMNRKSLVTTSTRQALYFSTDSTVPFPVTIYNNNTIIGTVTISNGNPAIFTPSVDLIITTQQAELFKPTTRGLYAKADKDFLADLRVSEVGDGEIITSKGKSAIGKKFYAAYAPITNTSTSNTTNLDFMCSFLATEDNTVVTVTGYDATVQFSNGMTGLANPSLTFTLNKGQSYLIDGKSNIVGNRTGFIGAKITSTKPISVTNGNYIGQYALPQGTVFDGSDITMDQAVPIERIGREYIIVKGPGNIGKETEGAIVVATENNTQIFLNGDPTAVTTINEGQFYSINAGKYINQGNNHYNMFIRTTKNAYVYHLVAGIDTSNGTGSFNIIPPITCIQSNKIDEIPMVDDLPRISNQVPLPALTTKLNVLTKKNANITINGNPFTASEGPYPVTGNPDWVTYIKNGVLGNIKVESDKPVSAELIGGSIFTGYSGYYVENSSCFDESALNITLCEDDLTIVPTFSGSNQNVNPNSVTIVTPPQNGTTQINNSSGVITYVPNTGYQGPDSFVYMFCNNNPDSPQCERVTISIIVSNTPKVYDVTLSSCTIDNSPHLALFNLNDAAITTTLGIIKKFYPSLADANAGTNEIMNISNYTAPSGLVYAVVSNAQGCFAIAKITLLALPPVTSSILVDKEICMNATTTLDAGPGFTEYLWSTGATTSSITNVMVGTYWVKLKTGRCWTTQNVKVMPFQQPIISSIEINNNTITINADGGTKPYQYSLDGIIWQDSNAFSHVPRGKAIVYVKDANNCGNISVETTVPNLINMITPNHDGLNDSLDYSALAYKDNFSIGIYDRFGMKVFDEGKDSKTYSWNGQFAGRSVSTGTYWYYVGWNESNKNKTPVKYTGWLLVKNRE